MTTGLDLFDRLPLELRFMIYRFHMAQTLHEWNKYPGSGLASKALQKTSQQIAVEDRLANYRNTVFTLHGSREIGGNLVYLIDSKLPIQVSWIRWFSIGVDLQRAFNRNAKIIFEQGPMLRNQLDGLKSLNLHFTVYHWCSLNFAKRGIKSHLKPWSSVPAMKIYITEGDEFPDRNRLKLIEDIVWPLLYKNMALISGKGDLDVHRTDLECGRLKAKETEGVTKGERKSEGSVE